MKPIKTREEHLDALRRIQKLWDRDGDVESEELDELVEAVVEYEKKEFPIED
jgi:antitoxin component HigA of HigAB toxin-antitoxin module